MALYAIGDLHLSISCDKPMDVFGKAWENQLERIKEGFECITDDDVVVLAGDLSWGMNLKETLEDFRFIDALPGRKIILKGNHDYWWETVTKTKRCFDENGITTIDILHNNSFIHNDTAICGTRGWFIEQGSEEGKIYKRELCRLEASLKDAAKHGAKKLVCALHYPPIYEGYVCKEIVKMLEDYKVDICAYGHLHGPSHRLAFEGVNSGVEYRLVSADYLDFKPLLL